MSQKPQKWNNQMNFFVEFQEKNSGKIQTPAWYVSLQATHIELNAVTIVSW